MVERERHDRHRNLVVAATGTGKTVVAALDYRAAAATRRRATSRCCSSRTARRSCGSRWRPTARSCATASFGEIHGGGRIAAGRHVFAMVQSLQRDRLEQIAPGRVRRRRRRRVPSRRGRDATTGCSTTSQPRELLGLTATPERLDGQDVTEWFDQRIAVELRLWEAIDQGFLVPVPVLRRRRRHRPQPAHLAARRLRAEELSNLLTNDDLRVAKLLEAIQRIVLDPGSMRALGFCVSKEHARYMARKFTEAGLESVALTGDDAPDDRDAATRDLQAGRAPLRLLRRGARRGRRRARRRLPAAAAADRVGDRLHPAARPRSAPRRRARAI